MSVAHLLAPGDAAGGPYLPIGEASGGLDLRLDLSRVIAGRLLVQGSSGAGKSQTLRRIVEEAFEYVTVILVDPEAEFANLAEHIGATTLVAAELAADGLTSVALSARQHRLPLHLDLSDLAPDERIEKAAAFFAGLMSAPREAWRHTVLVVIDEAHLLAPHVAGTARDAEVRRLGVATLAELCSKGRKRGIGTVLATQRLAKLAASVTSELHNVLIGLNVFDRDVVRAADLLGFSKDRSQELRRLEPGQFYALGPALCWRATLARIGETVTRHSGATPELMEPSAAGADEARRLLDLSALRETCAAPEAVVKGRGARALDQFLVHPSAAAAARVIEALRPIAPNATTSVDLARHLGLDAEAIDAALDLLAQVGAVDTMPRGEGRIARLAARLRLMGVHAPVVPL
jgi:hypothetical protein